MAFCECGSFILHNKNLKRHQQTTKHKNDMQTLDTQKQIKKIRKHGNRN